MSWFDHVRQNQIDWSALEGSFPAAMDMRSCIQDPIHHAEGDVWSHTKMVAGALALMRHDDLTMRLTALFHDVAKPHTRIVEYDFEAQRNVIRHPKHARLGANEAWHAMWLAGVDLETRLSVRALIAWHQRVFHMFSQEDMLRRAIEFDTIGDWTTLIDFALADNRGRICADPERAETELTLLGEWLSENMVHLDANSRVEFLERADRSPFYQAREPTGSRVVVLSGLPGVGKDFHAARMGLPSVSLDTIRRDRKVGWEDDQGAIIQEGLEQARVFLRIKAPFVWNSTGLTVIQRGKIIGLCRAYDAHVTVRAFDLPLDRILKQNREREKPVAESVITTMARKWEPPTPLEAHDVIWS